jgi:hypothetical protein
MLEQIRKIIREAIKTIHEDKISPSKDPDVMSFWHGGDLDSIKDMVKFSKSRYEYGPGLYLTTSYNLALNYSKGSRKLYMVNVRKGNDLSDFRLSVDVVKEFLSMNGSKAKVREVLPMILNWTSEGTVSAEIFLNIMLNESVMKPNNVHLLKEFLVAQDIDYHITGNISGWSGNMMVLFNNNKIESVRRVMPKDEIEVHDLSM